MCWRWKKAVAGKALGGENYRYADMLRRVFRICGIQRRVWVMPAGLLRPLSHLLLGLARRSKKAPMITPAEIDISKRGPGVRRWQGAPRVRLAVRALEQTLRDALDCFGVNGYIDKPVRRVFTGL